MAYTEAESPPTFGRSLKIVIDLFPKSKEDIESELNSTISNPSSGVLLPGFHPNEIRKIRIGLKKYNIGKQGGLRLIYLIINNEEPLAKRFHYHARPPLPIRRRSFFAGEISAPPLTNGNQVISSKALAPPQRSIV